MAASSPISRAGTPSRRPTGSSALTAGAGRRSNPNACWPARTAALSSPSISPGSASPCRRMGQPLSGKAMAPGKAAAPPPARCTTSPSRLPRPTPPSGRWPPSAGRLVLSSTGAARPRHTRPRHNRRPCPHRLHRHPFPIPQLSVSGSTRTTPRRSRGHRTIMVAGTKTPSRGTSAMSDAKPSGR